MLVTAPAAAAGATLVMGAVSVGQDLVCGAAVEGNGDALGVPCGERACGPVRARRVEAVGMSSGEATEEADAARTPAAEDLVDDRDDGVAAA